MSLAEQTGNRDGAPSDWHRPVSIRRYVGDEWARKLTAIDIDAALFIEYDDGTKLPLALVEYAIYAGHDRKAATIVQALAQCCVPVVEAYVVLYTPADTLCPGGTWLDFASLRVKRLHPAAQREFFPMTPKRWAEELKEMRHRGEKRWAGFRPSTARKWGPEIYYTLPDEFPEGDVAVARKAAQTGIRADCPAT